MTENTYGSRIGRTVPSAAEEGFSFESTSKSVVCEENTT
jgi:hypothetical protein